MANDQIKEIMGQRKLDKLMGDITLDLDEDYYAMTFVCYLNKFDDDIDASDRIACFQNCMLIFVSQIILIALVALQMITDENLAPTK
mmetsp:Transcript_100227/g.138103  ORF Transcript_100227/g.138103 Transcript_100227/m.138103 type:complete len:87 (-) Transcript_100227:794-1054(-)